MFALGAQHPTILEFALKAVGLGAHVVEGASMRRPLFQNKATARGSAYAIFWEFWDDRCALVVSEAVINSTRMSCVWTIRLAKIHLTVESVSS